MAEVKIWPISDRDIYQNCDSKGQDGKKIINPS